MASFILRQHQGLPGFRQIVPFERFRDLPAFNQDRPAGKSGKQIEQTADAKLHHDYQVELRKRSESSDYQLELVRERANH